MIQPAVTHCRIVSRERPGSQPKTVLRFADVFIATADGAAHYTRLWHELVDSPFARADQIEQFKRRRQAHTPR